MKFVENGVDGISSHVQNIFEVGGLGATNKKKKKKVTNQPGLNK